MKIHLTDSNDDVFWLAGDDTEPERKRGSVSGFKHEGAALLQENKYARGAAGDFYDRGNVTTTLSFNTWRTFKNSGEAHLFIADYDRTAPREGLITQLIENPDANGGFEKRYLHGAVVKPPEMSSIGCTVYMSYTIHGIGEVTNLLPA